MKYAFLFLSFLIASPVHAKTVATLFSCEQNDGDQWVEVGVAMNEGAGYKILVLQNNDDHGGSSRLVASRIVFKSLHNGKTVYEDQDQTIRLTIAKKSTGTFASLEVLQDGPGGFSVKGLHCYDSGSITFDGK